MIFWFEQLLIVARDYILLLTKIAWHKFCAQLHSCTRLNKEKRDNSILNQSILTYRFSVDWCPFFSFGAVIPYFVLIFNATKNLRSVKIVHMCAVHAPSGWKLTWGLWRLTWVNTELHKTYGNRYTWYGYINRYTAIRILASEINHLVMISQLVMNEMVNGNG